MRREKKWLRPFYALFFYFFSVLWYNEKRITEPNKKQSGGAMRLLWMMYGGLYGI